MASRRARSRRRALGQHYLIDGSIVELMVRLSEIEAADRVIEIGTGRGTVTRELCKVSSSVEGFELDHQNYLATQRLGFVGLTLHEEDALAKPREFDVLVSSLPYSESSHFVEWLAGLRYDRAVVLLQRDFAQKLRAGPGDDRYRAVSVISQISSVLRIVRQVTRESFDPPPKVMSVLTVISHKRTVSPEEIRLVKALFSQRRKRLSGALRSLKLELVDAGAGELSRRVETFSSDEVQTILPRIRALANNINLAVPTERA